MTERIKLTDYNIMYNGAGFTISVGIGKENKEKCEVIRKQILENQEITDKLYEENKHLKEIVETAELFACSLKNICCTGRVINDVWYPYIDELLEILGDKN